MDDNEQMSEAELEEFLNSLEDITVPDGDDTGLETVIEVLTTMFVQGDMIGGEDLLTEISLDPKRAPEFIHGLYGMFVASLSIMSRLSGVSVTDYVKSIALRNAQVSVGLDPDHPSMGGP